MINGILEALDPENYRGFLTSNDKSNFRFKIFPEYKQHRKKVAKPYYYDQIRDYLISEYKAEVVSGEEADDRISIEHCKLNRSACENCGDCFNWTEENKSSIIVSIDKDFNNVPGWHYNFVKEHTYFLTEIEALRNFYLQILTGDTADGIPRIKKGWREKEFKKKLQKVETESEMVKIVTKEIYDIKNKDGEFSCLAGLGNSRLNLDSCIKRVNELFEQRGQLLWLRRKEGELWQIPN